MASTVDSFSAEPLLGGPSDQPPRPARQTVRRKSVPRPPPVEIAFLLDYGVPVEALDYAAALARRQGVSADAALLAEHIVAEEVFYRALADHLRAEFLEGDFDLAPGSMATADLGYAALRGRKGVLWLFAPKGAEILRLMSAVRHGDGRPLFAITTRSHFIDALRRANNAQVARAASRSVERVDTELCVRRRLRRAPLALATFALFVVIASLFGPFTMARLVISFGLAAGFFMSVVLRLAACAASLRPVRPVAPLSDAQLPHYTVVIALYHEASVARQLARAIDRLDYPRAKLDVKFVVECDDAATAAALRQNAPRTPHEIVVAPEGRRARSRARSISPCRSRAGRSSPYSTLRTFPTPASYAAPPAPSPTRQTILAASRPVW